MHRGGVSILDYTPPLDEAVKSYFSGVFGEEGLLQLRRALCRPPRTTYARVNTLRAGRDEAREMLERQIMPWKSGLRGRACGRVRFHETVADVMTLAHAEPSSETLSRLSNPCVLDPADETEARSVIVDRLCGEAVLRGADVFVKGIHSAQHGIKAGDRVRIFVDLRHGTKRGVRIKEYADRGEPCVFVGWGEAQLARNLMLSEQRGLGVRVQDRVVGDAPPLNGALTGQVYLQNLPSSVVVHALKPAPGDLVIDLCCAPGGKTTHIGQLLRNDPRSVLVAIDHSSRKVVKVVETLARSGVTIAEVLSMDSAQCVGKRDGERGTPATHVDRREAIVAALAPRNTKGYRPASKFPPECFDKVLLDPPCSALGLRPRLTVDVSRASLDGFASMQRNFAFSAAMLVRVGGTVVYSTCTINPKENEEMVRYILDTFPCLRLVPAEPLIGGPGLPGLGLSDEERAMVQRFDPSDESDSIGFFAARFEKVESIFVKGMQQRAPRDEPRVSAADDGAEGPVAKRPKA